MANASNDCPIGSLRAFNTIKDEDIAEIVEDQEEYEVLTIFVDQFIKLRKATRDIDRYLRRRLVDMFQTNVPNAYDKSVEYINLRLIDTTKADAEKRIKSSAMYLASDLSFDEKRYEELSQQEDLMALVRMMLAAQKGCLETKEKIEQLKGFQFNT